MKSITCCITGIAFRWSQRALPSWWTQCYKHLLNPCRLRNSHFEDQRYCKTWIIVTSPGMQIFCVTGMRLWLSRHSADGNRYRILAFHLSSLLRLHSTSMMSERAVSSSASMGSWWLIGCLRSAYLNIIVWHFRYLSCVLRSASFQMSGISGIYRIYPV